MGETVKAGLEWTTAGVEKLEVLNTRIKELEGRLSKTLPAGANTAAAGIDRVAKATVPGGEKMARYATATSMLTGQMRSLGIQNEMVARGIGIVTEGFTGMLGPIGLATVAIGAMAAGIAYLVTQEKNAKAAIDEHMDSLIRLRSIEIGGVGVLAAVALEGRASELERMRAEAQAGLAGIGARYQAGGVMMPGVMSGQFGQGRVAGFRAWTVGDIRAMANEAAILELRIAAVNQKLAKMYEWQGPLEGPGTNKGAGGVSVGGGGGAFPWQGPMWQRTGPSTGIRAAGAMGAMEMPEVKIVELTNSAIESEQSRHYELMAMMQSGYADDLLTGYSILYGGIARAQQAAFKVTESVLLREANVRLTGLNIAKYVGAGLINATAIELGKRAEKKAAWEAAEAIASAATLDFRGAALHAAAAGAFMAIGGTVQGIGSAAMKGSERDLFQSGGGTSGFSFGTREGLTTANPGARLAQSGMAPSTINYNVMITYQGAVVYGADGARSFFYDELLPLIREAQSTGALT